MIAVQVCYAGLAAHSLLALELAPGASVRQAIRASGVLDLHPEIDLAQCRVGVFGKLKELDAPLHARDRVEIYRPLQADPMEARRRRAEKHARATAAART